MNYPEIIVSTHRAKALARQINFEQTVLTYVLWDQTAAEPQPIYVGTAKSQSRIDNHARKAYGGTNLTRKSGHKTFADYVERQAKNYGPDWLGFTFHQHDSFESAKIKEQSLIQDWGIKKNGGRLFNRQLTG